MLENGIDQADDKKRIRQLEIKIDSLEEHLIFIFKETAKLSNYSIALVERTVKIYDRLEKMYQAYDEHFQVHSDQLDELMKRIINLY